MHAALYDLPRTHWYAAEDHLTYLLIKTPRGEENAC